MIHSYCERGIYNECTAQSLKEGSFVHQLLYGDDGEIIGARVLSVNEKEIVLRINGSENVSVPIEEIIMWD